jgi:8-oxo-dGTP pyrophosphatase MutT (NUDIX family)
VETKKKRGRYAVGVDLIQDISSTSGALEGFLRRHRHRVKTRLSDGTRTDVYVADFIDRDVNHRDAVAIAVFSRSATAVRVLLRRQVRYAAFLMSQDALFTEVIAGLIEVPEPPKETVRRELYEEAGLEVPLERIAHLGEPLFVLPGTATEQIVPMVAEVSEEELLGAEGEAPPGDGSPMEVGAEHVTMTLTQALAFTRGESFPSIRDAKTEIVLERLERALARGTV